MAERCGDPAHMEFQVTDELVGKMAHIWVIRNEAEDFAGTHEEILKQAENKKIPWPDQEVEGKEGQFYGGRMADFRGLGSKSYSDRMAAQLFELRIFVNEKNNKSDTTLSIDAYPDAQKDCTGANRVGIPVHVTKWFQEDVIAADGSVTWSHEQFSPSAPDIENVGNYHIALKDGAVTITVKVKLKAAAGSKKQVTPAVFQDIKKRVETFWNGSSGYLQWVYHRTGCQRGKACKCAVLRSAGKVVQAGCCKFPVSVVLEEGPDNEVEIEFLSLWQKFKVFVGSDSGASAHTALFPYPEDRANTYAHEIGHMMGFPDEYETGHVDSAAIDANCVATGAGTFPIDNASIMGGGMVVARERHFKAAWIKDWVESNTDPIEAISASE